ncbi:MAG: hypothetical protein ABI910_21185, partial [Gemmatimonadota bacterium]
AGHDARPRWASAGGRRHAARGGLPGRRWPFTQGTLAYALARAGRDDEAASIRASLEARAQHEYVSPVALATAWLGTPEPERALEWIEQPYAHRRGWVVYLNVNPFFDPVRHTERFQSLVRRMGLPVSDAGAA